MNLNLDKVAFATLNLNSLPNKFIPLAEIVSINIDVPSLQETKIENLFLKDNSS